MWRSPVNATNSIIEIDTDDGTLGNVNPDNGRLFEGDPAAHAQPTALISGATVCELGGNPTKKNGHRGTLMCLNYV